MRWVRWLRRFLYLLSALLAGPLFVVACGGIHLTGDWRTADRSSTGIAPDPARTSEAVVQVYAARAFAWRGVFGVHTWIATKSEGAPGYTVHEVVGWRLRRAQSVVVSHPGAPDRTWFGSPPEVLLDIRGPQAAHLIPAIEAAVASYPYPHAYAVWPGPNSNTFTAWVARRVPELGLELPVTAIGKDYLPLTDFLSRAPSGSGYQVSVLGLLGVLVAVREGLELNLLGLSLGIDPLGPALKLPGVGRVGLDLDRRLADADG